MRNFKISIKPENQQVHVDAILLNNSSLEYKDYSSIKADLLNKTPLYDALKKVAKSVGGRIDYGLQSLSMSGENSIRVVLCEIQMYSNYMNRDSDDMKEIYSEQELSDFSIIDITRSVPSKKGMIDFDGNQILWSSVTIKFTNLLNDSIQYSSDYNIHSYEWDEISKEINREYNQTESIDEQGQEEADAIQKKRDDIKLSLGERAEHLEYIGDFQALNELIDDEIERRELEEGSDMFWDDEESSWENEY